MPLIPLRIPPGFSRNSTEYDTKGRWFDGNLVRWLGTNRPGETSLQPIGGWAQLTDANDAVVAVSQPPRSMFAWKNDAGIAHLAIGSFCKAWAFVTGTLTEITPAGISCGTQDASVVSGGAYGKGLYSAGPYGGLVSDTRDQIIEAGSWQFDAFGEILIGNPWPDNKIYEWDLNPANDFVPVANAPTANAIVVTPEQFLVALGAAGDRRLVKWSDQNDRTVWTPTITNQAGDFPMSGGGDILAGRAARNETLIWTETDLWAMRFIGGDLVYGFDRVGANVGATSRHSMAIFGSRAFWMGRRGFFVYDGFVQELPSAVADLVFNDMNHVQRSKIVAIPRGDFNEVTWHYPSAASIENDSYVTYNFQLDIWYFGKLDRTAGVDRGVHQFPISASSDGKLYDHEKGFAYLDPNGTPLVPFAETGPIEIAEGDEVLTVVYVVPDDKTVGDVNATLGLRFFPDGPLTTFGPFILSEQTAVRKTARSVRLKLQQVKPNWRVGTIRLDVRTGGRR